MLNPIDELKLADLLSLVRQQFVSYLDAEPGLPVFVPLGEDSWSYRISSLWVSVRRDLQGHVPAAYAAASELYSRGLSFVLGPLPGLNGQVVNKLGGFPIVVFPYIECEPLLSAQAPTDAEVSQVIAQLNQVHLSDTTMDLPIEKYHCPFFEKLSLSLALAVRRDPDTGPFSAELHKLIARNFTRIRELMAEFQEIAALCIASRTRHVLTHGEPSAGNFLRSKSGLLLADWGAAMWGPPERDWYHVNRTIGRVGLCRPQFERFYELRWILGEICEYVAHFCESHCGIEDDYAMWSRLMRYMPDRTIGVNA